MTGIDSNVLVRYLVKDDPVQSRKAVELFQTLTPTNKGFISLVAIVESIWVLGSVYKQEKELIRKAVLKLLGSARLQVQSDSVIEAALSRLEPDGDLADIIIAEIGKSYACETTATFDKKAAKLAGMSLL